MDVNLHLLKLTIELQNAVKSASEPSRIHTLDQVNIRDRITKSVPDFIYATPSYVANLIEVLPINDRYPFLLLHLRDLPPSYCYLKMLTNTNKTKFIEKAGIGFVKTASDLVSYLECFTAEARYHLAVNSFNPATMKGGIGNILKFFNVKEKVTFVEKFINDLIPSFFEDIFSALHPASRKQFVLKHINLFLADRNSLSINLPKLIAFIPQHEQTQTAKDIIKMLPQKEIAYNAVVANIVKNIPEADRFAVTMNSLPVPSLGTEYQHIENIPLNEKLNFALGLNIAAQHDVRAVLLMLPLHLRYKYISQFPQYLLSLQDVSEFSSYLSAEKVNDFIGEQMSRLIQKDVVKFSNELIASIEKDPENEDLFTLPVVKNAIQLFTQRLNDYKKAIHNEKSFVNSVINFLGISKNLKYLLAGELQSKLRNPGADADVLQRLLGLKSEWMENGRLGAIYQSLCVLYSKKIALQHAAQQLSMTVKVPSSIPAKLEPADEKEEVAEIKITDAEDPEYVHPDDEEKVPLPDKDEKVIHFQPEFEEYDPADFASEEEDDGPAIVFSRGPLHQQVYSVPPQIPELIVMSETIFQPAPRPNVFEEHRALDEEASPVVPEYKFEPIEPQPISWLKYALASTAFVLGVLACATGVGAFLGASLFGISLGVTTAVTVGSCGVVMLGTGIYTGILAMQHPPEQARKFLPPASMQPAHPRLYQAFLPSLEPQPVASPKAIKLPVREEAEFKRQNVNPAAVGVFKKKRAVSSNDSVLTQFVGWIRNGFH